MISLIKNIKNPLHYLSNKHLKGKSMNNCEQKSMKFQFYSRKIAFFFKHKNKVQLCLLHLPVLLAKGFIRRKVLPQNVHSYYFDWENLNDLLYLLKINNKINLLKTANNSFAKCYATYSQLQLHFLITIHDY